MPPVTAVQGHTRGDLLRRGRTMLCEAGIRHADQEVRWLLEFALGVNRLALELYGDGVVARDEAVRALDLIRRRAMREPLQYLLGTQEFCGLDFQVEPGVLIPRPETELLVQTVVEDCQGRQSAAIADIGTGSGCIAVSVARALPHAHVTAVDLSAPALGVARRNAARHGMAGRIRFLRGDLCRPLSTRGWLDAIASNPPYLADRDFADLQPEIGWEPREALWGGPDGLLYYRRLLDEARSCLKPGGLLALELGHGQSRDVVALVERAPQYRIRQLRLDHNRIPRVIALRRI